MAGHFFGINKRHNQTLPPNSENIKADLQFGKMNCYLTMTYVHF